MLETTIITLACLIGVITQRIVGFGIAPFLAPVVLVFLSPPAAVVTTIFVGTLSCAILLLKSRSEVVLQVVGRILLAAVPGLLLGSFIVSRIDKAALQIILGLVVISAVVIQEFMLPKPTRTLAVTKGISVAGFLSGLMNAAAANGAPPMAMWLRSHVISPDQIRQNLAAMFVCINACSLTAIISQRPDSLNRHVLGIFLALIPSVLLGNYIGIRLIPKVDRKLYEKFFVVAVLLTACTSIAIGTAHFL
jgi:uncharacterized membrane protein YfcA